LVIFKVHKFYFYQEEQPLDSILDLPDRLLQLVELENTPKARSGQHSRIVELFDDVKQVRVYKTDRVLNEQQEARVRLSLKLNEIWYNLRTAPTRKSDGAFVQSPGPRQTWPTARQFLQALDLQYKAIKQNHSVYKETFSENANGMALLYYLKQLFYCKALDKVDCNSN
jgi:hypothetical protein